MYPENVAFPIGGPGAQQHIVVEMHYDNPEGRDGKYCCSCLSIHSIYLPSVGAAKELQ